MESPSVPVLVLVVFGATTYAIVRARAAYALSASAVRALAGLLASLLVWVVISSVLSGRGVYLHPAVLPFLPLLVGFAAPTLWVSFLLHRSHRLRAAVLGWILWIPFPWLLGVHALRIGAIGTIAKYLAGEFPGHFILPVAVPDLLIGVTALPLARWASPEHPVTRRLLIGWNLLGALLFAYAGLALHFSVPGPLQFFTSGPTTEAIFRFPLALVPTFLVPFFVGVHVATLWRLVARPS